MSVSLSNRPSLLFGKLHSIPLTPSQLTTFSPSCFTPSTSLLFPPSPLIPHHSSLAIHPSPFIPHLSFLTIHPKSRICVSCRLDYGKLELKSIIKIFLQNNSKFLLNVSFNISEIARNFAKTKRRLLNH